MGSSSTEFTDFQRLIVNILSYCPVSLITVEKDKNEDYSLVASGWIRTSLYIFIALNTISKFFYLLFLVFGYFGPIDFLDKMCAFLWILMCMEILQELLFWSRTYPLFEVLANLWKLENDIYKKLGSPYSLKKKSFKIHRYTLILHTCILIVGCILIGGQFVSDPKYAVYTYAAFKRDNTMLLVVFTFHEVCFMWQAWTGYLSIVTISSLNAVEMTFILSGMSEAFTNLQPNVSKELKIIKKPNSWDRELGYLKSDKHEHNHRDSVDKDKIRKKLSPPIMVAFYNRNVELLIADYKKLMLVSDLLNSWCGYRIVGVHFIGYCQFISDVFMMIQLIRLTDMEQLATVMWFGEDATACLYMIFRMFSLMSRVAPASEKFMRAFKHYLRFENPTRKRLIKVSKTLRLVSLKLGPSSVRPKTVGAAVMMLMNYYLCVALWKS